MVDVIVRGNEAVLVDTSKIRPQSAGGYGSRHTLHRAAWAHELTHQIKKLL